MNRSTVSGAAEEARAAGALRENRVQDRLAADAPEQDDEPQGDTLEQMGSIARLAKDASGDAGGSAAAGALAVGATQGTAKLLKSAWINLLDTFGLTLIYINIHVLARKILGGKIFCALGEEWVPGNQRLAGTLGLVEKLVLIFLDVVVV